LSDSRPVVPRVDLPPMGADCAAAPQASAPAQDTGSQTRISFAPRLFQRK
jgi:hypothetical protein